MLSLIQSAITENQLKRCFWKKNNRGSCKKDKKIDWNTNKF